MKPLDKKFRAYDHRAIESKWRDVWVKENLDVTDIVQSKKPFYNLMMFPYPSAEGLHVGNMYAFTGSDIYGRFKRMQGYSVFEPIGLDGFGIHSENYSLKIGRHPMDQAKTSEKNFYNQLQSIGAMFDWTRALETYNPDYYQWTQWLFVQMFKHGLAYRGKAEVNWCPSDKTVLADEQVIDGRCERCGNIVEKKLLEQWFFRITAYAGKLLENLSKLDWSEKVKVAQKNWIGKKEGINITYQVKNSKETIVCFTTTPVNWAATFLVLSPEHPSVLNLIKPDTEGQVKKYIEQAKKKKPKDRIAEGREKTGVFTGSYAINHVNGEAIPIWISDFVIMSVGTGAIQACPGHDMRDFEFAMKFKLPIKRVVVGPDGDVSPIDRPEKVIQAGQPGTMMNSDFLNGLPYAEAMEKTKDYFEKKEWGKRVTTYHLRDWLISRQRYWGPPIPMIYCEHCAKEGMSWFTSEEARAYRVSPFDSSRQGPDQVDVHKGSGAKAMTGLENASRAARFSKLDNLNIGLLDNSMRSMVGWYPVPEKDLPVLLPRIEDYKPGDDPDVTSGPLAKHKEFYHVACPECGRTARRETDVSDTFLDSSWYFLRYPSVFHHSNTPLLSKVSSQQNYESGSMNKGKDIKKFSSLNSKFIIHNSDDRSQKQKDVMLFPWNREITQKWLPVDMYTGGAEHSVLHLLYSRFVTMALHDWGYLDFDEPFTRFFAHGLVIKEGAKMSKSKGNVVTPDEYIAHYGADSLRLYLMFMGPYDAGGDFRDSAMEGMARWAGRVWRMALNSMDKHSNASSAKVKKELERLVKKVGEDIERRRYNTAIAAMMEFTNVVSDEKGQLGMEDLKIFIKLLAPFAPYLAEELWQRARNNNSAEADTFFGDAQSPQSAAYNPSPSLNERSFSEKSAKKGQTRRTFSAPQNGQPQPHNGAGSLSHFEMPGVAAPTYVGDRAARKMGQATKAPDFSSVHTQPWPTFDAKAIVEDTVQIVVQVNGKLRDTLTVQSAKCKVQSEVEKAALASEKVKKFLDGQTVKKVIFVPGRLINFVV